MRKLPLSIWAINLIVVGLAGFYYFSDSDQSAPPPVHVAETPLKWQQPTATNPLSINIGVLSPIQRDIPVPVRDEKKVVIVKPSLEEMQARALDEITSALSLQGTITGKLHARPSASINLGRKNVLLFEGAVIKGFQVAHDVIITKIDANCIQIEAAAKSYSTERFQLLLPITDVHCKLGEPRSEAEGIDSPAFLE